MLLVTPQARGWQRDTCVSCVTSMFVSHVAGQYDDKLPSQRGPQVLGGANSDGLAAVWVRS